MSDSTQPAASAATPTPADRIKACIKKLTGLSTSADGRAKPDLYFVVSELLDVMLDVHKPPIEFMRPTKIDEAPPLTEPQIAGKP